MSYTQVATRTTDDANSHADINQLQLNIEALKGGLAASTPVTTIDDLNDFVEDFSANVMTELNATGDAPVYACRAWVNFDGTGSVAIRASGNVESITDNGTGLYTLNFVNALPDANYAVSVMSTLYASNNGTVFPYINGTQTGGATVKTTTALQIIIATAAGGGYDMAEINVSIFR